MKQPAHKRKQWIKEDNPNTAAIFQKYPRLLDTGMVEQDFEVTLNENPDALFKSWPRTAQGIASYVEKTHLGYKDTLNLVHSKVDEEEFAGFSQCKFSAYCTRQQKKGLMASVIKG
ncbi:uncharacterized protein LOC121406465 [Lytechinus variegatus]|uniref:uncharacterized protein LOC121406465 n=1 Tax=Lytechinus variegatus TaxID=7654 RepID=UPI001BB2BCFB|nr:uncharacterized protein LOC121406465 [Lytechinus variegatus]